MGFFGWLFAGFFVNRQHRDNMRQLRTQQATRQSMDAMLRLACAPDERQRQIIARQIVADRAVEQATQRRLGVLRAMLWFVVCGIALGGAYALVTSTPSQTDTPPAVAPVGTAQAPAIAGSETTAQLLAELSKPMPCAHPFKQDGATLCDTSQQDNDPAATEKRARSYLHDADENAN